MKIIKKQFNYYLWQVCPSENWAVIIAMANKKSPLLNEYVRLIDGRKNDRFNYFVVNKDGTSTYAWNSYVNANVNIFDCLNLQREFYEKHLKNL